MVELRAYTSAYGARLAHGLGSIPSAGTSISMLYLCNKLVDKFVCCAIIHSCVEKSACRSESCLKTTNKKVVDKPSDSAIIDVVELIVIQRFAL